VNAGTSDASFFFAIEFKPPAFTNLQKNHSQLDLFHVFLWALSSPPGVHFKPGGVSFDTRRLHASVGRRTLTASSSRLFPA
jgi:hypothetical protein